ncbi:MAG: hypothetical protein QM704_22470 [Anaeromyxobacteraceae bacterium]
MRRPALGAFLSVGLALGAAGCQDYNFNPVGKCLIQPATERVKLSDVSSADVLFVIDDSGSMEGEQAALSAAFSSFVTNLDAYNQSLVSSGLQPFDYHLAVTTTSVMFNNGSGLGATCRSDCSGHPGSLVCCDSSGSPVEAGKSCAKGEACGTGFTCRTDCTNLLGEKYCCDASGTAEKGSEPCVTAGATCGRMLTHYDTAACTAGTRGVAVGGTRYPQGDFVSLDGQPRVLHFDKSLYQGGTGKNRQGFTSAQLIDFFKNSAKVGICGSGEETGLLAGKMAVEKALAGQQKDTYDLSGAHAWNPTTLVASANAEWPRPGSKLVLVFVGDEDDCSSPVDATAGVVWDGGNPGADACVADALKPAGSRRQYPTGDFVNYFMGLGRPIGAAFVVSMAQDQCGRAGTGACTPGVCCGACPQNACTATCGGQAAGFRFYETAQALRGQGADVFTGSICDGNFSLVLDEIANIVRPPAGLVLPTTPAESVVTLLRIAATDGQTRKICKGPAPAGTTAAAAKAGGWDWWFTATRDGGDATGVSRYVFINNETGNCRANPGETYSADYIGRLPADGCQSKASCASALGGQASDWACVAAGVPAAQVPATAGTCICCAAGSTDPCCNGGDAASGCKP